MKKLFFILIFLLLPFVAQGALIGTLTDNFDDNSIDVTKWVNYYPAIILETNQRIEITTTGSASEAYLRSKDYLDYISSGSTIKIINAGDQSLYYEFQYYVYDGTEYATWTIFGGDIHIYVSSSDVYTDYVYTETYNADTYRYLGIRESGGTIYWDYSSDGINWTNAYSCINYLTVSSMRTYFNLIWRDELSTTTVIIDDFNILPSATSTYIGHEIGVGIGRGILR